MKNWNADDWAAVLLASIVPLLCVALILYVVGA